jgi:hypothetical protein
MPACALPWIERQPRPGSTRTPPRSERRADVDQRAGAGHGYIGSLPDPYVVRGPCSRRAAGSVGWARGASAQVDPPHDAVSVRIVVWPRMTMGFQDWSRIDEVPALVSRLYDVVDELGEIFPGRHFSPELESPRIAPRGSVRT